ncbi:hypothetical protein J4E76_08655 [Fabibacter sp. E12]|nr:hypothetical protein [Roseivirga sp. E12]
MTDEEFDVMDELYFVQPFSHLIEELEMNATDLKSVLKGLLDRDWIKCFYNMNEEVFEDKLDFDNEFQDYYYLATKTGLLAHNGR